MRKNSKWKWYHSMKYYVDFDGCITHSIEAICKVLDKEYGKNTNPKDIVSWNFECCYDKMTDEEIEKYFAQDDFFVYLKFIDGAKEFLSKTNAIIVTKGTEENIKKKKVWLELNDVYNKVIGIPLNESKRIVDMSNGIFIDDSTKNLIESNADIKIQFREYGIDGKDRVWINGWNGIWVDNWKSIDNSFNL